MSGYDYIAHAYGKTFTPGQRVRFTEGEPRAGTVMRPKASHEHYVRIRFDGEKHGSLCHPGSVEPEAAPMTSPTPEGALDIERALGEQRMAEIRAEAFRAGAEAMREAAAVAAADSWGHTPKPSKQDKYQMGYAAGHAEGCRLSAARIRSLDIPEEPR